MIMCQILSDSVCGFIFYWESVAGSCGWVGKTVSFGQVPARYLQLHLHQEDSVMVGEDLVYSLFATPLIVFGALSGLWPLASGLWPLAKGG